MEVCKNFNKCGGCKFLNTPYDEQLKIKQEYITKCLKNEGINFPVEETFGMYYPYKYRNKLHLAVKDFKGKTTIGFFEEGSNKVIPISSCILFDNWINHIISITNEYIKNFKILGYNKDEKYGTIKYIVARKLDNQLLICIVATNQNFSGKDWFFKKLKEKFNNVSFYLNINTRTDNEVFGNKFILKGGNPTICGNILDVKFELSPNSFFQTNEKIATKMYEKAVELLDIKPNDTVFDLYSGIGITSILFAKKQAKVISVEFSKSSVLNAKKNAKLNSIENSILFNQGLCKDIMPMLDKPKNSLLFLDPARSGAEPETLKEILKLKPKTIVYMSCNPESLAGDLKILLSSKLYKLTYCKGYDMFPQTNHIEILACLKLI